MCSLVSRQRPVIESLVIPLSLLVRIFGWVPGKAPGTPVGQEPACLNSENSPSPHLYKNDTVATFFPG
jgi:hypothetical protein